MAAEPIKTMLSCSVRKRDEALVKAFTAFLREKGFAPKTIGINASGAAPPDDAVRALIADSECLVGIATVRFLATDVDRPSETLHLATQYLGQEAGAAHQIGLPHLMFKAPGLTLHGVTARNIWHEVSTQLSVNGRLRFANKATTLDALDDLRTKALELRAARTRSRATDIAKNVVVGAASLLGAYKVADYIGRPDCYGGHDGRLRMCKECSYASDCRTEKLSAR